MTIDVDAFCRLRWAVAHKTSLVLPERWVKPVVKSVIVPAHAAASPATTTTTTTTPSRRRTLTLTNSPALSSAVAAGESTAQPASDSPTEQRQVSELPRGARLSPAEKAAIGRSILARKNQLEPLYARHIHGQSPHSAVNPQRHAAALCLRARILLPGNRFHSDELLIPRRSQTSALKHKRSSFMSLSVCMASMRFSGNKKSRHESRAGGLFPRAVSMLLQNP